MTWGEAVAFIESIKLAGLFSSFRFKADYDLASHSIGIALKGRPPERDSGRPIEIKGEEWFPLDGHSKVSLLITARRMFHAAVTHEADESLSIGGVRLFDPHRNAESLKTLAGEAA